MVRQDHSGPKLRLSQAQDGRPPQHHHNIWKCLETLKVRQGMH